MNIKKNAASFGVVGLVAVLNSAVNSSLTIPVANTTEIRKFAFDNCHGLDYYAANPAVADRVHRSVEQDVPVTAVFEIPIYKTVLETRGYGFSCETVQFQGWGEYNPFMGAQRISRAGVATNLPMEGLL